MAGGPLKDTGTTWQSPNTGATNSSGFSALPGGNCGPAFNNIGSYGFWWSSSAGIDSMSAWSCFIGFDFVNVLRGNGGDMAGFSVRCLKN